MYEPLGKWRVTKNALVSARTIKKAEREREKKEKNKKKKKLKNVI